MKSFRSSLILLAAPLLAGCAIGPPPREVEPSVTADCCHYLQANWLDGMNGTHAAARQSRCQCQQCSHAEVVDGPSQEYYEPPTEEAPMCETGGGCLGTCPLGAHPDFVPCADPGPPGRFLPVPVRPVFAPALPQSVYSVAPELAPSL